MNETLLTIGEKIQRIETELSGIQQYQEKIQRIETELSGIKQLLESMPTQSSNPITEPTNPEFEELKRLLASNDWPAAVNPSLICNISSEQDEQDRAEGILGIIINKSLKDMRFLDFGCGKGYVVAHSASQKPAISVGYDVVDSPQWTTLTAENIIFTTTWEDVVKNGPFDVILLYDVIDHIVNNDPIEILKKIKPLLRANGKVYARCHPWCSRHATHLYHELNKAFVHLVFNEDEIRLVANNWTGQKVRRIIHPLLTYNDIFVKAGFRLAAQPQIMREPVEPFFVNTPILAKRIKANWSMSHDSSLRDRHTFPLIQMEQQFLDYVLL